MSKNIVTGRRAVYELLCAGSVPIEEIYLYRGAGGGIIDSIKQKARENNIPVRPAGKTDLQKLTPKLNHQGVIAVFGEFPYCAVEDIIRVSQSKKTAAFILVLDRIEDAGNFGAIIRSACCASVDGIIIPAAGSACISEGSIKSSSGSFAFMKIARVNNLANIMRVLKKKGICIIGSDSAEGKPHYSADFKVPAAIVVGNEHDGISQEVKQECDLLVRIPITGVASLNASSSSAVLLFEAGRQRALRV